MTETEWIVAVDAGGRRQEFDAARLPVTIGSAVDADVPLNVPGSVQIGRLGGVYFVQAGRNARGVRVGGEPLAGTRELHDGDVIALDRARLACRLSSGRLEVSVELLVTAGDTAPPDLDAVARRRADAAVAITPIAFKPGAAAAQPTAKRLRPATISAGAALAVLLTAGWFAFTAKSVALNIEPEPASVSLPGTLFKVRVGDRFLLRPGSHRVAAVLDGYYPLETEIDVGPSPDQSIDLTLTKLPGIVSLSTDPEINAEVLLDGMPLGRTPLADAELTPGLHRLEFGADRYLSEVLELEVTGGGERQALVATLTPNWAPVTLASDPPGATVLVDGVEAGVTPAAVDIDAGEREIELRLSGFNAWRTQVLVNANQPLALPDVKLTKADGRVEIVSTPSEATVSIDDEFRGRTPITVRLTPERPHKLTLTKPGYDTVTRELSVAADSGRRVQVELTAQYGDVEVSSEPSSAEIWVDGQRQGLTPSKLTLTAVQHLIEVKHPGYAVGRVELTPRPGFPQVRSFTLVPLDQNSGSGYAETLRSSNGHELKLIPAGQFTMGSSRREQGRRSNEILRPVKLTKAFYLGTREVTNAEFRAFKPSHDSGEVNGHSLNGDSQPVVRVTWDEAAQFMNWLSIKDGYQPVYEERGGTWVPVRPLRNGYRLPTEAEWEWAARFAGQEAALLYPWGNDLPPPDRSGNYADIAAAKVIPSMTTLVTYNDGFPVTAPSGSFAANAFGIHDLGGNVAEWVQDYYVLDAAENPPLVEDPLGPETGRFHVVRGSSWRSATVTDLRLAYRNYEGGAREDIGFRLARNLE